MIISIDAENGIKSMFIGVQNSIESLNNIFDKTEFEFYKLKISQKKLWDSMKMWMMKE